MNPRLTLNLGVRYSLYGQPWDARGLLSSFLPSKYSASAAPVIDTTGLICPSPSQVPGSASTCNQTNSNAGQSTTPNANADIVGISYINGMIFNGPSAANNNQASPWGTKVGVGDKKNFAPRLGFALDVFGDGKTALRGGWGIAFDDVEISWYESADWNNPPAVATYSVGQTSFENPTGGATTAFNKNPIQIRANPLTYNTPYIQQYSLDVQQQISPSFMFDLGYFGDHGTHLFGAWTSISRCRGLGGEVTASNSSPSSSPSTVCVDPDPTAGVSE